MKIKRLIALGLVTTMVLGTSITSFAAEGWNRNDKGWWYEYADGSYPVSTWKWINGKKYYFNGSGYMLENTTTPDGKSVNGDGAWTVNGVVQNDNYDPNYPLKGMTEDLHLVTNGRYDFVESSINGSTSAWAAYNDSDGNGTFLTFYVDRLSGKIQSFDEVLPLYPEEAARYEATYQVMKNFLNTFDWRNSSDKTKAEMVARLLGESDYLNSGSELEHMPYGVLVQKKGVCESFALSFLYLTRLMGMESAFIPNGNHSYNVVKIDGKWYQFDGSANSANLASWKTYCILTPADVVVENGVVKLNGYSVNDPSSISLKIR